MNNKFIEDWTEETQSKPQVLKSADFLIRQERF